MNSKQLHILIQGIKMMPAKNVGCTACVNGKKIWALAHLCVLCALLETHSNRTACKTIYVFIGKSASIPFEEEFQVVYTFSNFNSN